MPPTINPVPPVVVADGDGGAGARADAVARRSCTSLPTSAGHPLMPDVRGLGAREALRVLGGVGLTVRVTGVGGSSRRRRRTRAQPVESGGWSVLQLQRSLPTPGRPGGER